MGLFRIMGARRRMKECRRRYPELWTRGERMFLEFDSKRRFEQRPAVEAMLASLGYPTDREDLADLGVFVGEALAHPDSAGIGLDLSGLDEQALKLYYIVLDGFMPDELMEMTLGGIEGIWPEVSGGRNLTEEAREVLIWLSFINAYMRRRHGVRGF